MLNTRREIHREHFQVLACDNCALDRYLRKKYTRTKETNNDGEDTRYSITETVGYQLMRKLNANLDLGYQNQDSGEGCRWSRVRKTIRHQMKNIF
jgi:hypothetical protein